MFTIVHSEKLYILHTVNRVHFHPEKIFINFFIFFSAPILYIHFSL